MDSSLAMVPLADTMQLGKVLAESGFFQDSRSSAQAVVKVLAGRELGIGAVASMTGINIIQGRVALSANLIAALVKRSGRYGYQVAKLDDDICTIRFTEAGKSIGESTFTRADATKAGTRNMDKFPRNMLFARAMSNGAKWFCADIFGGPVYTPEELGANVNEDGDVIEGSAHIIPPEHKARPAPVAVIAADADFDSIPSAQEERAQTPAALIIASLTAAGNRGSAEPLDEPTAKKLYANLKNLTHGDNGKGKRLLKLIFGVDSTKDLTIGQAQTLCAWINSKPDETGEWVPMGPALSEYAVLLPPEPLLA